MNKQQKPFVSKELFVLGAGPDSYRDEPTLALGRYSIKQQKLFVSKELLYSEREYYPVAISL